MLLIRLGRRFLAQRHPRDPAAGCEDLVCKRNVAPDLFNVLIRNASVIRIDDQEATKDTRLTMTMVTRS